MYHPKICRAMPLFTVGLAVLCVTNLGCGGDGSSSSSVPAPYVTSVPLNVMLIGSVNNAPLRDVRDELTRMGDTVTVAATLSAPVAPYPDVVLLHPSASLTSSDADTIRAYLGKSGVVMLSNVPNNIVAGMIPKSLTPVSDFFGGAQGNLYQEGFGGSSYVTTVRPNKLFDAPDTGAKHLLIGNSGDYFYQGALSTRADIVMSDVTDPLSSGSQNVHAFAFVPDAGGRVYWQTTFGVTAVNGTAYSKTDRFFYESVLDRGMRWAAGK